MLAVKMIDATQSALLSTRIREFIRFAVTGGLSLLLNMAIVIFLTERVGLNYLVSMATCFLTVTFISYWLNRVWTFRKTGAAASQDLLRYIIVTAVQLVLSLTTCSFCVEVLHIPYVIAMLMLSVLLVPVTFFLHRRWSFDLRWWDQRA
jgi:putative flippase GtrA